MEDVGGKAAPQVREADRGPRDRSTRWSWLPLVLWMVTIFIGSSIPGHSIPRVWVFSYDKVIHACEYALLGALGTRAAGGRGWAVLWGAAIASLYGASDELHQRLVPGRACDVYDWIADTIGGTVGAFGWRFLGVRLTRRHAV